MVVSVTAGIALAALLFMKRMAEVTGVTLVGEGHPDLEEPLPRCVLLCEIGGPLFFGAAQKAMSALRAMEEREVRVVVPRPGARARHGRHGHRGPRVAGGAAQRVGGDHRRIEHHRGQVARGGVAQNGGDAPVTDDDRARQQLAVDNEPAPDGEERGLLCDRSRSRRRGHRLVHGSFGVGATRKVEAA
jgi:hypothetical protein